MQRRGIGALKRLRMICRIMLLHARSLMEAHLHLTPRPWNLVEIVILKDVMSENRGVDLIPPGTVSPWG